MIPKLSGPTDTCYFRSFPSEQDDDPDREEEEVPKVELANSVHLENDPKHNEHHQEEEEEEEEEVVPDKNDEFRDFTPVSRPEKSSNGL